MKDQIDYYIKYFHEYDRNIRDIDPSIFLTPLIPHIAPPAVVLDIGCASGRDMLWFKKRGYDVIGFERSPGLMKLARSNTGSVVIGGDFLTYDFSWLAADAILLVGALVHIQNDQLHCVLARILKALKMNGYVLLTMKQGTGQSGSNDGRTFFLWQDSQLRSVFHRNNLSVVEHFVNKSTLKTGETWLGYVLKKGNTNER
jgi:SAM-dependent methyltransferase